MSKQLPFISIVIPARNEEKYVSISIAAAKAQDYAGEFEVIVVDNGSVDKTAEVAASHGAIVVSEPRSGVPQAREAGRLKARGELIVYVDADTTLPPNYLTVIQAVFEKKRKTVATSNPFTFYDGTTMVNLFGRLFFAFVYPMQNLLLRLLGKQPQVLGGSFAVRSSALEAVDGFDTSIKFSGEDLAISKRLAHVGTITIIHDLYAATSARRYKAHGTLRTCAMYVKDFFSVLFLNHKSDGTFLRKILKFVFLFIVILIVLRIFHHSPHIHLNHINRHGIIRRFDFLLIPTALLALYGTFYQKSQLFGVSVSQFNTNEKIISLTFDDGPSALSTPRILDILRDEGVTATFFVTGQHAKKHPELLARAVREGHELGNHSYRHRWLLPFVGTKTIHDDVAATQRIIDKVPGQAKGQVGLFRPPHGWRSPWMMTEMRRSGYEVITWSIGIDYIPGVTVERLVKHVTAKTRPGSILLFHDTIWENPKDDRQILATALPVIIQDLKKQGYQFAPVRKLL